VEEIWRWFLWRYLHSLHDQAPRRVIAECRFRTGKDSLYSSRNQLFGGVPAQPISFHAFLLKLSKHEDDQEVRLFKRYRGLSGKGFKAVREMDKCVALRVLIDLPHLFKAIKISPICPEGTKEEIYNEFTHKQVPAGLLV
jgi:hypothetical protein